MPLIAAFAYADNICYEQSQFDPFEDCSSIDEVLEAYLQMTIREHQEGVESDPSDPDYFLEFVQEAKDLKNAWELSIGQEDTFLALTEKLPGNCLELAEIVLSGSYCDLRF